MHYQLIKESFPVAKKEHRCIWCGEDILKGEKYRKEVSVFNGIQHHSWHLECNSASEKYFQEDGPEFDAYENERPK